MVGFPRKLDDPPERDLASNRAPAGVFDAHVHIFPEPVFNAIWGWFDEHAWLIRYRLLAGEIDAMLDRYQNLYLDVSTMLAGYFTAEPPAGILERRWDRLLYGTDFPNLPYAWDRDLRAIEAAGLSPEQRAAILGGNARRLLGLDESAR